MLCIEFEDHLTGYLDDALSGDLQRAFAEHALRCPICHDLLNEVRNSIRACHTLDAPPSPQPGLEARILRQTAPETLMTCEEFEQHLTDYLDGFLPAPLYHRWQRHTVLCSHCTDLPGQVVRAIGACYSYVKEERAMPVHLHQRILQATLGTTDAQAVRASLWARLTTWVQGQLSPSLAPQLAPVGAMMLIAVLVGTSVISDDGTIGGMYRASLRLATRTYTRGATTAARNAALSGDLQRIADEWSDLVSDKPRGAKPDRTDKQSEAIQQSQESNQGNR